jgi:hypothetical protein
MKTIKCKSKKEKKEVDSIKKTQLTTGMKKKE